MNLELVSDAMLTDRGDPSIDARGGGGSGGRLDDSLRVTAAECDSRLGGSPGRSSGTVFGC